MTDMARIGGSPPGQPCWDLVTGDNRPLMVSELAGKPVSLDVETVGTDPWQGGSLPEVKTASIRESRVIAARVTNSMPR